MRPSQLGLKDTATASLRKVKPPNECPGYDINQSDGQAPVLKLWGM